MSNRIVASFTVCVVVAGATACTLAAYSAYAMRPGKIPTDLAISAFAAEAQTSNRATKASRLALLASVQIASVEEQPVYVLASAHPIAEEHEAPANPAVAVAPSIPENATQLAAEAAPKLASVAPAHVPQDKPKRVLPPPPPAPTTSGLLDDGQIAGLKGRLRLTSDQAGYWPAVEAALRDVVRTQLRGTSHASRGGKMNIDVNAPEVQKLIWAAMPLLMRLREDQKTEVRRLARVIGLDQVASQI